MSGPLYDFYIDLMHQIRAGVIYDTTGTQKRKEISAADLFDLKCSFKGEEADFQFDLIKGAKAVTLEVKFLEKLPDVVDEKHPKFDLLSHSYYDCSFKVDAWMEAFSTGEENEEILTSYKRGSELRYSCVKVGSSFRT